MFINLSDIYFHQKEKDYTEMENEKASKLFDKIFDEYGSISDENEDILTDFLNEIQEQAFICGYKTALELMK